MLEIADLHVRYGPVAAIRGLDLKCREATIVALVGPNGAGKSTTLRAVAGSARGARVSGDVKLDSRSINKLTPEERVRAGISLVPEGRRIFTRLTVEENLRIATTKATAAGDGLDAAFNRFPALGALRDRRGGLLSGGEQQQLAIARALMTRPRLLLLDEPSLGLAPKLVDQVFQALSELRTEGLAILLVEQHVSRAAELADQSFVLRNGKIVGSGTGAVDDELLREYFGRPTERVNE
jgi:branched-chain amino acid transport system ATP-binding protein